MKYTIMNNKSTKIYELIFIFPNLLKGKVEAWFCKKKNSKIPLPIFQSLPEERRWQNTTTLNYDVSFQLFNSGPSTFYYLASNICTICIYVLRYIQGLPLQRVWFYHLQAKTPQKWSNKDMIFKIWLFFLINILVKLHIRWWDALYYIVFTKREKKSSQELLLTLFHYLFFCSNFFQVRYILQSDM